MRPIFGSLSLLMPKDAGPGTPFTYFLKRPGGNILLGTKADVSEHIDALEKAGGVALVLLGDRHHALPHTEALAARLGAPLRCSDIEAAALKRAGVNVREPLAFQRAPLGSDLEIIPTPGHTPGALSYLWTHAQRRFLFVGDTIVPVDGAWQYWVAKPKRAQLRATLAMLATIPFDVVVSNSLAAKPVAWLEVTARSRAAMFTALADSLAD